jgi:pyruvate-formate lyase-activating enzyme
MPNKITDINKAKQEKHEKSGWTMEEIKKNAEKELEEFNNISENEPDNLVSGDMDKIIRGDNDDD